MRIPLELYGIHIYGWVTTACYSTKRRLEEAGDVPLFIGETGWPTNEGEGE